LALAVVRDLREQRRPATEEELAEFETDVLAGFVLARASAGLADGTIRGDVGHLDQARGWFGRPFPSELKNVDGTARRVGDDALRAGLAEATTAHLPGWSDTLTPHVLRHYCASQLYLSGMDLISVQELLGHAWVATTMKYVHVHRTRIEDAWIAGQQRAADRLEGLLS
jgi:hypothetical protein